MFVRGQCPVSIKYRVLLGFALNFITTYDFKYLISDLEYNIVGKLKSYRHLVALSTLQNLLCVLGFELNIRPAYKICYQKAGSVSII